MFFTKVVLHMALGLFIFNPSIDASCNSCSQTTYASCFNDTAFYICFDGKTQSTEIGVCADDKVCTDQQGICKPKNTFSPTCDLCNACSSGFACISQTQFEYCEGSYQNGIIGKCPDGHYCSLTNLVTNHNICIKSCSSTPTCYKAEVIPTPAPKPDYNTICESTTAYGYYENIYDSTCKTYVYCETLNNVISSFLYNCTSGYFSPTEKKCVATKPSKCT